MVELNSPPRVYPFVGNAKQEFKLRTKTARELFSQNLKSKSGISVPVVVFWLPSRFHFVLSCVFLHKINISKLGS